MLNPQFDLFEVLTFLGISILFEIELTGLQLKLKLDFIITKVLELILNPSQRSNKAKISALTLPNFPAGINKKWENFALIHKACNSQMI
jgi:hypothetical protein